LWRPLGNCPVSPPLKSSPARWQLKTCLFDLYNVYVCFTAGHSSVSDEQFCICILCLCLRRSVAVNKLPDILASPSSTSDNRPMPHHRGSIHLNVESMGMIHQAFVDATHGNYSQRSAATALQIALSSQSNLAKAASNARQREQAVVFIPIRSAVFAGRRRNRQTKSDRLADTPRHGNTGQPCTTSCD